MDMKKGEVLFIGRVESVKGNLSTINILKMYNEGIHRLSTFSHIIILYWFHNRDNEQNRSVLKVTPKMHKGAPEIGVFTSRSPSRPNPIGLCVTELISVQDNILIVKDLDAEEGSPIVDIKPYLPQSDAIIDSSVPNYMKQSLST